MSAVIMSLIPDQALIDVIAGVLIALAADTITGWLSAIRHDTFNPSYAALFLKDQGTQVAMIIGLALIAGSLTTPFGVMAAAAAAAYGLQVQKSVRENLGELLSSDRVNAIPSSVK